MGKKSAPAAPDYSQLAAASERAANISAGVALEQLDWAKEQDQLNRALLDDVLSVQMPIMIDQWENSVADRARYEEVFQPIEDDLVAEFTGYASPERKTMEAGRAMSDVARAQDAQREQAVRRLEDFGIDPSQTRSAALDANLRAGEAAAMAGAGNAARDRVENVGRALRAEAINIGKGLPSQVAQSYGQAIAAGNAGVAGANQTTATSSGALTAPSAWMNSAQSGYGNAANIMNTGYQNQLAGWQAGQAAGDDFWGGVGSIAGMAGGMMMMAEGGPAIDMGEDVPLEGELIRGPGGPKDDAIEARLSDGEYVIPEEVVRVKGTEFFDKLIEKTQQAQQQRVATDPKYANQRPPVHNSPHGQMPAIPGGGFAEGGPAATQPPQQTLPVQQGQPAISFQGADSWRQYIPQQQAQPTPQPAPQPAPNGNPGPAVQPQPGADMSHMQALKQKWLSGQGRTIPTSEGRITRNDGESLQAYFARKYGIGTGGSGRPAIGAIPEMSGREYYNLMQQDYQAMRQADPFAQMRMNRFSSPEDKAYYDFLKRTYGPQQVDPYANYRGN